MRKIAQFLTAVALGVAALGAQAQNLVTNGSFEAVVRGDGASSSIVFGTDGWGSNGALQPSIVNVVGSLGNGAGEQFAQLTRPSYGTSDTTIDQKFTLAAGSYTLSFLALGSGEVDLGKLTFGPTTVTPVLYSVLNSASWAQYTYSVTTTAASTYQLVFSTASDLRVDNVSVSAVTAVPEPETYAMMLAGLGAIGFLSRRRKQAA